MFDVRKGRGGREEEQGARKSKERGREWICRITFKM
jgi:hypothetical protein